MQNNKKSRIKKRTSNRRNFGSSPPENGGAKETKRTQTENIDIAITWTAKEVSLNFPFV